MKRIFFFALVMFALFSGNEVILIEEMLEYHNILLKVDETGDTVWVRELDVPAHSEFLMATDCTYYGTLTRDGGFVLLNTLNPSIRKISRLDAEGNLLWVKEYSGIGFKEFVETADSGFIAVGYTDSYETFDSGPIHIPLYRRKPTLFKLDTEGDMIWRLILNLPSYFHASEMPDPRDGFILTGSTFHNWRREKQCILARVSEDGDLIWEKELFLADTILRVDPVGVKPTHDRGFLIAGYCEYGPEFLSMEGPQVFAVKTDSMGAVVWFNVYDSDKLRYPRDFIQPAKGEWLLVTYDEIIKLDSLGNLLWEKEQEPASGGSLAFKSITPLPGDEFLIIGEPFTGLFNDITFSAINTSGDMLWARTYGDSLDDRVFAARPAPDGGYLILGQSSTPNPDPYMQSQLRSLFEDLREVKGGD